MTQRTTILFVAEAVTLAHVARPWVLARSLDPARYDRVFAADERFDRLFDLTGLRREPLNSISSKDFLRALAKGSPVYDTATLVRYVEEDLALLERVRPDLVVGDFRLSLSVSARRMDIPYATIANVYWSPFAEQSYPIPELPLTRILGVGTAQLLFDRVRPAIFALHTIPLNRMWRRYGLPSLGTSLQRVYTDADQVLYADLPELVRHRPLPSEHRFIGPVIWSPDIPCPPWWEAIDSKRPIVYATLGSSGNRQLVSAIVAALGAMDITGLVATAGGSVEGAIPANVRVADYLPGAAAAARAALVVCNGGSPTTYQALAVGVPVIGIATNLDQFLNMTSIERAGAGLLLRSDRFRADRFRGAVERVLREPEFAQCAQALAAQIGGHQPEQLFSRFVEEIL